MPETGAGTERHSLFGRTGPFYVQRGHQMQEIALDRRTFVLSGVYRREGARPERQVRGRTTRRIDTSWFHSATRRRSVPGMRS